MQKRSRPHAGYRAHVRPAPPAPIPEWEEGGRGRGDRDRKRWGRERYMQATADRQTGKRGRDRGRERRRPGRRACRGIWVVFFLSFLSLHSWERNSTPNGAAKVPWDPHPCLCTHSRHTQSAHITSTPIPATPHQDGTGPQTQLTLTVQFSCPRQSRPSLVTCSGPLSPAGAGLGSSPTSTTYWWDVDIPHVWPEGPWPLA